jgi:hypothetical protein
MDGPDQGKRGDCGVSRTFSRDLCAKPPSNRPVAWGALIRRRGKCLARADSDGMVKRTHPSRGESLAWMLSFWNLNERIGAARGAQARKRLSLHRDQNASRQSGTVERKTLWEGVVHVYALEGHPMASQHQPPDEVGEGGAGGVVKHPLPTIIVIDFPPTPLLPR